MSQNTTYDFRQNEVILNIKRSIGHVQDETNCWSPFCNILCSIKYQTSSNHSLNHKPNSMYTKEMKQFETYNQKKKPHDIKSSLWFTTNPQKYKQILSISITLLECNVAWHSLLLGAWMPNAILNRSIDLNTLLNSTQLSSSSFFCFEISWFHSSRIQDIIMREP
jgi:hypothetical protein